MYFLTAAVRTYKYSKDTARESVKRVIQEFPLRQRTKEYKRGLEATKPKLSYSLNTPKRVTSSPTKRQGKAVTWRAIAIFLWIFDSMIVLHRLCGATH